MSKDDFELYRHLRRDQGNNGAFDLLRGLEDRRFGYLRRSAKSRENVELFAEEQFIRRKEFDEMRCEMPGIPRSTFLMVFSPDGCRVASTHGNHNIYITDIRSGKNIKTLVGHPRTPWCIAFHPTSDQIVASGCLGGQVRIWDLSGGSEVWTTVNQTVIASLAFHPNDRLLVIATFNEVYFWDWSQPEPFIHAATNNPKEKVRYVAFDKLGHKLITGIANTPQTRWERVRAPVPVPRQERCASPYRRRITQRLVTVADSTPNVNATEPHTPNIDTPPDHPDRERRITLCYRNLVREYEQLVQRYLQLYRPPAMMDRGTDPMDENSRNDGTAQPSEPSTSNQGVSSTRASPPQPGPSTSGLEPSTSSIKEDLTESSPVVHTHLTPSRVISVIKKPPTVIKGTQTSESRKHKAESEPDESQHEKRIKKSGDSPFQGQCDAGPSGSGTQNGGNINASGKAGNDKHKPKTRDVSTQASCGCVFLNSNNTPTNLTTQQEPSDSTRLITIPPESLETTDQDNRPGSTTETHVVVIKFRKRDGDPGSSSSNQPSTTGFRIRIPLEVDVNERESSPSNSSRDEGNLSNNIPEPSDGDPQNHSGSSPNAQSSVDELLSNIRRTAEEEVRNRILPIIRSVPANDRPELIRLFENSREHVRMRFRQMYPIFLRKPNRRFPNIPLPTTDSSSSEEDRYHSYHNRLMGYSSDPANSTPVRNLNAVRPTVNSVSGNSNGSSVALGENAPVTGATTASNFNTALEQLVTSLLTEIERNETERSRGSSSSDADTTRANSSIDTLIESPPPAVSTPERANHDHTPHYHDYHSPNLFPPSLPTVETDSVPRNPPLAHRLFQECLQMLNPPRGDTASPSPSGSTLPTPYTPSTIETPTTIINTNTRTTNSTIYTSNSLPRRRFFSHRISAFMPTRVNYTRSPTGRLRRSTHGMGRGRLGLRSYGTSFALDELINYAERENSEDDPPSPPYNFSSLDPFQSDYPSPNENVSFNNIYTNILSDIVSSLSDIMHLRAATRLGETSGTSGILSSFSERLESIVNQSDTILRNLNNSTEMLANTTDAGPSRSQATEPTWSFSDQNFYVRDQRVDPPNGDSTNSDIFLSNIFNSRPPFSAIAADHTYPRNLDDGSPLQSETVNPLMTCIHLTISHIQRQARLLRQRVDVIERMDRAVLEVTQLQLIRNMIVDLMRYLRTSGDTRSTGMSSVRQMMAGTRISDSSPQESIPEEQTPANTQPGPSSSNSPSSEQVNNIAVAPNRPRLSGRKTYPPSRLYRLARECRRRSILHFFSRRYVNRGERNPRQSSQARSTSSMSSSQEPPSNSTRNAPISNFSIINSNTLGLMTRRFEHLLTEQMRIFTSPAQAAPTARTTATIDLGEHILSLRLHGCILRMNRILRDAPSISTVNVRADPTAAVTHDGVARYGARHTLSLLVDSMTRFVEMGNVNISPSLRNQMQRVLAMSLLLTELMLFIVSDSVPSPTGGAEVSLERETGTARLCDQMLLRHRHNSQSSQLARSLRLMKVTMRRAQGALGQTYHSRRAMLTPRQATDRWQLLGCINRCLRSIRQRCNNQDGNRQTTPENPPNPNRSSSSSAGHNLIVGGDWYNSVSDLVNRYATEVTQEQEDELSQPSTSSRETREQPLLSDNSDGEDDEPEGPTNNNYTAHNSNLYRSNNMNLLQNDGGGNGNSNGQSRPWNVPSVQVNDIPVSEPSSLVQRIMTQRQRFAERVSELRSNPSMGLFRPRFLHPLYASVNPFDGDLDDPQREQIYDNDIITTVTPNHRIQAWDISNWSIPVISNTMKNLVVSECKIHNDASVDVAKDGTILVTLLPSGGYLNVTNRLGVYSLKWETLGQCLYTTSFEQNAVSVSLSPLSRHLVVGLASRIVPSERWIMARVFKIDQKEVPGDRLPVLRELEQNRDSRINCIRWLPNSGQGLIYATNTGQLVILS